jgi:hypothetical protein
VNPRQSYVARPAAGLDWRAEALIALVVTAFATLLGSVVGVVWHALAPQVAIIPAAEGSAQAMKALIGDDLWLALLGIVAGVLCVGVSVAVAPASTDGPGAAVGLAVGGLLGMLVAARVGHLIGHRDLTDVLRAQAPGLSSADVKRVLSFLDFSARWKAALLSWPIVSVLLHAAIAGVRGANQPTRLVLSAYPGSS